MEVPEVMALIERHVTQIRTLTDAEEHLGNARRQGHPDDLEHALSPEAVRIVAPHRAVADDHQGLAGR